jgi:hypothetical protein
MADSAIRITVVTELCIPKEVEIGSGETVKLYNTETLVLFI